MQGNQPKAVQRAISLWFLNKLKKNGEQALDIILAGVEKNERAF